ncbi:hypothetical protein [Breznakia pachnodae]|uniref:Uncharacterized protein n=1 Tax=Breznakia pachnodae TaxID=265178 RepID=A0ABU0E6N7_9FIRM|nr:hypothetical protein [Breznakia pachnodae]MDQ0362568.1 hypothetical protein [Breznakia pachnodae]
MKIVGIPIEDIQAFFEEYIHLIAKVIVLATLAILLIVLIKRIINHSIAFKYEDERSMRYRLRESLKVIWRTNRRLKASIAFSCMLFVAVFGYYTTTSKILESGIESGSEVMVFKKRDDGKYYFIAYKQYYPDSSVGSLESTIIYNSYSSMNNGFSLDDKSVYLDENQKFKVIQSDEINYDQLCYMSSEKTNYEYGKVEVAFDEKESKKIKCIGLTLDKNTIELPYTTKKYKVMETTNYLFGLLQFEEEISNNLDGYTYEYEIYLPTHK